MKTIIKFELLFAAALAALVLGSGSGSVNIPPLQVVQILLHRLFGISLAPQIPETYLSLVMDIRLPRVLLAFLVGGAMAANGAVIQSVLKNPLASPYGVGVSAGAGLGVALVMVCGVSASFVLPIVGLVFGLVTVVLVLGISFRIDRGFSNITVVLTGMVISLFLNAVMTFLATLSPQTAQRISLWQLGSFSSKPWDYVAIFAGLSVLCLLVFCFFCRELDLMTFGEEQAMALGVNLKKTKWILLTIMAVWTGTAVSFVGIIGFVDLIAPHIVRKILGASHRAALPANFLFGGAFMVLCDLVARTVASPREIPIGSVTALIGAPFFVYVYFVGRKGENQC